jgi:hypothetical protein
MSPRQQVVGAIILERRSAMASKNTADRDQGVIRDPDEWKTGGEPMTAAQDSYLHTLAGEAGEPVEDDLTKAEASKKIDELQEKTGRGQGATPRKRAGKRRGS